jgi:hypothetical protein
MSGHHEKVSLPGGETGNSSNGGGTGINALGIDAAGGAVIDVVASHGGVSVSGPGQGNALSSLSEGERTEQERSHAQTQSGGPA